MSDFLSNFDNNNYKNTVEEKNEQDSKKKVTSSTSGEKKLKHERRKRTEDTRTKRSVSNRPVSHKNQKEMSQKSSAFEAEETETDPSYQAKQKKKRLIVMLAALLLIVGSIKVYYSITHVKMPNLINKPVSEVRGWAQENKMELDIKQSYSKKYEINRVMKQGNTAGKNVKKKSVIKVTASLGPDPEEVVALPDFSKMTQKEAEEWAKENRAENLTIHTEYHDTIEKGQFIKQEFANKEVTAANYKRKDQAIVYYSKGKEKFEKNIEMPDFVKKTRAEVDDWAKKNEMVMTYKEVDSNTIEEGLIISQSVPKSTKVAKREKMSVEVSTGKSIMIPNFSEYNEESAAAIEGLNVSVQSKFSSSVPYGQLISQSVAAGTKMKIKDGMAPISVVYSAGQPYLRSYYGNVEGDLAKSFFEDYQSKGADITYTTYYVDSDETKGTVVSMSRYNEYVPLDFSVSIGISNGSGAGTPTKGPKEENAKDME